MGDYVSAMVRCRAEHASRFERLDFGIERDHGDGTVTLLAQERRPNFEDWPRDVPYIGHHDGHREFGPRITANDGTGTEGAIAEAQIEEYVPNVRFDRIGLNPVDLRNAKEYWEWHKKAERALGVTVD